MHRIATDGCYGVALPRSLDRRPHFQSMQTLPPAALRVAAGAARIPPAATGAPEDLAMLVVKGVPKATLEWLERGLKSGGRSPSVRANFRSEGRTR